MSVWGEPGPAHPAPADAPTDCAKGANRREHATWQATSGLGPEVATAFGHLSRAPSWGTGGTQYRMSVGVVAALDIMQPDTGLLFDSLPLGIVFQDDAGRITAANPAAQRILGLTFDQMRGVTSVDPRWRATREDGSPFAGDEHPAMQALRTGREVRDVVMGIFNSRLSAQTWIKVSATPVRQAGSGIVGSVYTMFEDITQSRELEARFEATFEQAAVGLAHVGTDGSWLRVNRKLCEITGYSREQLLKLGFQSVTHPNDAELDVRQMDRMRAREIDHYAIEKRYVRRDGSVIWVGVTLTMNLRPDGTPDYFIAAIQDIQAHKDAEAALRQSLDRMEAAARAGIVGVWDWDIPGDQLVWDSVMYQLYGLKPGDFAGAYQAWASAIHPDDRRRVEGDIRAALQGEQEYAPRFRVVWPDGSVHMVQAMSRTTFDARGLPLRMIGVNYDVTELDAVGAALRDSEDRFRYLFEHAPLPISLTGLDGVLHANAAFLETLGYSLQELTDATWRDVCHPDDMALTQHVIDQLVSGQRDRLRFVKRFLHKSGETVWADVSTSLRRDAAGAPLYVVAYWADITETRRMTEELDRHRNRLEEEVKARTLQLEHAKEAAEAANLAKSNFLANMSHEIRTPINAITGMAYLIRQSGLQPKQQARLDKIEVASQHLLAVINDILDISKIEAGKLVLESNPVNIETITANVYSIIFERASAKGLKVVVDTQPMPLNLFGDAPRLQQALLNFASNAVKFTGQGTITLRSCVVDDNAKAALIRFEVTDTGCGIAPEAIGRLFTRFEQADNSTTRRFGGSGLGLVIARRIAECMGGEAGVVSEVGKGSTFWFTARLPKGQAGRTALALVPGESVREGEQAGVPGGAADLQSRRVLVVEDDAMNREVMLALLDDTGLSVTIAENGQAAVELALQTDFDLIFMDMQMPLMGGVEAARRIRATARGATVPIVALTANAFIEDRQQCFEAGMSDFLPKPFLPQDLYATLHKWLARPAAS